ncbi:flagellar protein FlaG [Paenisporosarcina quisquiliarum]|uniref:flagellar protein FlaG n=1 Tax=Paenisporosarcina quisquiliarum TaxID=365346 RepID=UPI0037361E40
MLNRLAASIPVGSVSSNSSVSSVVEAPEMFVQPVSSESFQSSQPSQEQENPLPAEKAKKMTESINRFMETTNTNLRFQYHEDLKEYYVTIVDSKTNELVKEIPSKKLMDIYAAMRDFLGIMVDRKI